MVEIPVFYATTEGQTRRIAERIASVIAAEGVGSQAIEIGEQAMADVDWTNTGGVILGASLHMHHHQRAALRFVRRWLSRLNERPSAFFSVSLSVASKNAAEVAEAKRIAREFVESASWTPRQVACFAGRLAYTRYGVLTRWIMKRIARHEGGSTDTSRDHELTNWAEVDEFARAFAAVVKQAAAAA